MTTSVNTRSIAGSRSSASSAASASATHCTVHPSCSSSPLLALATSGLSSTSRTVLAPMIDRAIVTLGCYRRFVRSWQVHGDARAFAETAFDLDSAAGLVREAVDLREAEA